MLCRLFAPVLKSGFQLVSQTMILDIVFLKVDQVRYYSNTRWQGPCRKVFFLLALGGEISFAC